MGTHCDIHNVPTKNDGKHFFTLSKNKESK